MKSNLIGRKQRVTLEGCSSSWSDVSCGVQQGSILDPLLLLVYVDDLTVNIQADDTCLYFDDASFCNIAHGLLEAYRQTV